VKQHITDQETEEKPVEKTPEPPKKLENVVEEKKAVSLEQ